MTLSRFLLLALPLSFLATLATAGGPSTPANPKTSSAEDGWLTSVEAARQAARAEDSLILVDLYADWCGWCKVLEKEVFTTPEFHRVTKNMVLLRVDVEDGAEGTQLQARFGARSLPTTLILDAELAKVGEISGYAPAPRFIASIQGQLDEYGALLFRFDRVRRGDNVAMMRQVGEDFHRRGDGRRAAELYEAALPKVNGGDDRAAWLHYLAADAHRLSGELSRATERFTQAQRMAAGRNDERLDERLDMLRFYLAQASGDCPEAMASLEQFIASHPGSGLRKQARNTLTALRRGEGMECT